MFLEVSTFVEMVLPVGAFPSPRCALLTARLAQETSLRECPYALHTEFPGHSAAATFFLSTSRRSHLRSHWTLDRCSILILFVPVEVHDQCSLMFARRVLRKCFRTSLHFHFDVRWFINFAVPHLFEGTFHFCTCLPTIGFPFQR